MTTINISAAKTSELVAFYNAHAPKPVNKFADRKTAERRVAALIASMPAAPAKKAAKTPWVQQHVDGTPVCPKCGSHIDITCGVCVDMDGRQHLTNEHLALCHSCGHEWNTNTGRAVGRAAASPTRRAAIAASWKNAEVAARRAQRNAVKVGDKTFRSVREAFVILSLPLGQHIRFRGALKAAGAAEFAGHKFQIL